MQVSRDELLHIAKLAELEIKENEIESYLLNLQDILEFAEIINNAHTENLNVTIGANEAKNIFRKDEVKVFEENELLLQNAPAKSQNMFKVPKVLQ